MSNLFSEHSLLNRILTTFANWITLNFCFLIGCIGILPIGISSIALYSVSLKLARHEDVLIMQEFFKAYRRNWRQGFFVGVFFILFIGFLLFDIALLSEVSQWIFQVLRIFFVVLLILTWMLTCVLYPLMARYQNHWYMHIKNAIYVTLFNPITIFSIIGIQLILILAMVSHPLMFGWIVGGFILFGFGCTANIYSIYLNKVFDRYEKRKEESSC